MINKTIQLPSDTVLGKKMFGGYVYSMSCEFGGNAGRSSLTLSCVSENGSFSTPNLSHNLQSIKIGSGVSFQGKLLSYRQNSQPGESTLELVYKDGSDILDKIYVGLFKRHSKSREGNPKSLIIVGKEYHPCDKNFDSSISQLENSMMDWCDPCPFYPENKYRNTCSDDAALPILDVKYTFNELLNAMSAHKVSITAIPDIENVTNFPKDYSGPLRTVLQQWCADFGLSFYWDWRSNSLCFVDLKDPVNLSIQEFKNSENLSAYSFGESIEDTYSRGVISYYAREGKEQSYSCGDDRIVGLVPFFVSDLYNSDIKSDPGLSSSGLGSQKSSSSKKIDKEFLQAKELAIGLSYYSKDMREAFWLYNYYKINSPEAAMNKVSKFVEGSQICEGFYVDGAPKQLTPEEKAQEENNILSELGDMKILDVIAPGPEGSSWNTESWNAVLNAIQQDKKRAILDSIDSSGASSHYFIVARCNLEKLRTQYELSASIAEQFMGRYWHRRYTPIIGGGEENYKNVSVEGADGSASFYSQGTDFSGHPICGFGHRPGSYIDRLVKTIIEEDTGESKSSGSFSYEDASGSVAKEYEIRSSIIIAERDPKWFPNRNDIDSYQYYAEYFQQENGIFLVGADGRPDVLGRLYPCAVNDKGIVLLMVKKTEPFPITVSTIPNFYEIANQKKIRRTLLKDARNSNKPYSEYREIARTGLRSNETQWVTFDGFGFMMPVGSTSQIFESESNSTLSRWATSNQAVSKFSIGGFAPGDSSTSASSSLSVRVTQDYNVPVNLPKLQECYLAPPSEEADVSVVDYYYSEMDSVANELKLGSCDVNLESLKEAHRLTSKEFGVTNSESKVFLDFSAFGVFPIDIAINQGLDTFNIAIGENGAETRYSLSSKYKEKPEANIMQTIVEKLNNRLPKKAIGGNLDGGFKPDRLNVV